MIANLMRHTHCLKLGRSRSKPRGRCVNHRLNRTRRISIPQTNKCCCFRAADPTAYHNRRESRANSKYVVGTQLGDGNLHQWRMRHGQTMNVEHENQSYLLLSLLSHKKKLKPASIVSFSDCPAKQRRVVPSKRYVQQGRENAHTSGATANWAKTGRPPCSHDPLVHSERDFR